MRVCLMMLGVVMRDDLKHLKLLDNSDSVRDETNRLQQKYQLKTLLLLESKPFMLGGFVT
jgi:hypothetical protein